MLVGTQAVAYSVLGYDGLTFVTSWASALESVIPVCFDLALADGTTLRLPDWPAICCVLSFVQIGVAWIVLLPLALFDPAPLIDLPFQFPVCGTDDANADMNVARPANTSEHHSLEHLQ